MKHQLKNLNRVAITLFFIGCLFQIKGVTFTFQPESQSNPLVHVIKVESIITPVSADFIVKSIEQAEEERANCLIVLLDTPGGLLESTRQITKKFLAAKIPIISTAAFFIFALSMALKTHKKQVTTGQEGLISKTGIAQTKISPEGQIKILGEIWNADSKNSIKKGEKVRVISVNDLTVTVEKAT